MDDWLPRACDYIASWLEFQMRLSRQPGRIAVVMHRGQIALERAFGSADLAAGEPLTPRHRFRIASHSKSFTAAGVMKLREAGKLRLDGKMAGEGRLARPTLLRCQCENAHAQPFDDGIML